MLRQSGVSVLITLDRYKSGDYLAMVRALRPTLPGLREVIVIGSDVPLRAGEHSWHALLERA